MNCHTAVFALRRLFVIFAALAMTMTGFGVGAPVAHAAPSQISIIVVPHPDDEYSMWSLVNQSSANYKIFVFMTQGEESGQCKSTSRKDFQGPNNSITNQPDLGEINPLGPTANIWVDQWTSTCKDARRESTLAWLRSRNDATLPSVLNLQGSYSFTGNTSADLPPRREDRNGDINTSRTAVVYHGANGMGKVIFFDLGDGDLKKEEVAWAVQRVRSEEARLGIPTNLPEVNVLGAFSHNSGYGSCNAYLHQDHKAVHDALWSLVSGRRHARTCSTDPDRDPNRTRTVPSEVHKDVREMSGTRRVGLTQRRYGWLQPQEWTTGWGDDAKDQIRAAQQHWWTR